MLRINIVCVGKIKEDYLKSGIEEYTKRLSSDVDLKIIELAECKIANNNPNDSQIQQTLNGEGKLIMEKLKGTIICLCIEGNSCTSEEFSKLITTTSMTSSEITFVIGGSYGLSDEVKRKADKKLSFSKMTFPHQLMRLILVEQIYRAISIEKKTPYHK